MDNLRFASVCEAITGQTPDSGGIGTLGEKTLHVVLKHYIEPDSRCHEIPVGGFVADIKNADGIIEIQTRSLDRLLKKLPGLLQTGPVTVVYPLPCRKTVSWIDPDTGEVTKARRSPKTGRPYDSFRELYKLRTILPSQNLTIRLMMIDMAEYRYLNGWSRDRKRGSSRCDRVPEQIAAEYFLSEADDFRLLLPPGLPAPFTAKEFRKAAKVSERGAGCGIALLRSLGIITMCGKEGRAYLYRETGKDENNE